METRSFCTAHDCRIKPLEKIHGQGTGSLLSQIGWSLAFVLVVMKGRCVIPDKLITASCHALRNLYHIMVITEWLVGLLYGAELGDVIPARIEWIRAEEKIQLEVLYLAQIRCCE